MAMTFDRTCKKLWKLLGEIFEDIEADDGRSPYLYKDLEKTLRSMADEANDQAQWHINGKPKREPMVIKLKSAKEVDE